MPESDQIPLDVQVHDLQKVIVDHDERLEKVEKKLGIGSEDDESEYVTKSYFRKFVLPDLKTIKNQNARMQVIIAGCGIAAGILLWLMHMGILHV